MHPAPYLLGLLAMIECGICSYQSRAIYLCSLCSQKKIPEGKVRLSEIPSLIGWGVWGNFRFADIED